MNPTKEDMLKQIEEARKKGIKVSISPNETIHSGFGQVFARSGKIDPKHATAVIRAARDEMEAIKLNGELIIRKKQPRIRKIKRSARKVSGEPKSYKNLFDTVIEVIERSPTKNQKRYSNFEIMPNIAIYHSLGSPNILRILREEVKNELDATSFHTGDDLERCLREISKNKNLYDASIDKTILAIALTKEYNLNLKNKLGSRNERDLIKNNIENIIVGSLLQDYALRKEKNAKNIRDYSQETWDELEKQWSKKDIKYQRTNPLNMKGKKHGVKGSEELNGKRNINKIKKPSILPLARVGIIHHENHQKWEGTAKRVPRIVALANDLYNKAKEGLFIRDDASFDYPALFKALSYVNPGKQVNVLTAAITYYEINVPKETERLKEAHERSNDSIKKRAKLNIIKKVSEDMIKIHLNGSSNKVIDALAIYSNNRVIIE